MPEQIDENVSASGLTSGQTIQAQKEKGWLGRNWLWLLPLVLIAMLVCSAVSCGAMVVGLFSTIKSTDIYQDTLYVAQSNPRAIQALGEPIKPSFFLTGSIDAAGPFGTAELAIPVSGPKGSGTVSAIARLMAEDWNYILLQLEVDETGERIDLLSR